MKLPVSVVNGLDSRSPSISEVPSAQESLPRSSAKPLPLLSSSIASRVSRLLVDDVAIRLDEDRFHPFAAVVQLTVAEPHVLLRRVAELGLDARDHARDSASSTCEDGVMYRPAEC